VQGTVVAWRWICVINSDIAVMADASQAPQLNWYPLLLLELMKLLPQSRM